MAKPSKPTKRPDAVRQPATTADSDPAPTPERTEMVNVRLASSLLDQLDAAAYEKRMTRKQIITHALKGAGFDVPQSDLENRSPRRRRQP